METLHYLLSFVLHIDSHLTAFVTTYGIWAYGLLFLIIFCETGLVVTPFLPGDSLLFAAGAIAASTSDALNIHLLFVLLVIASITGNGLNYFIGRLVGPKVFFSNQSLLFNKNHLTKAHQFYERFGGKTIIFARFIPIIRTFAPFVAGIAYMSYRKFFFYNVLGAILWIGSLLYISFWFGNLPAVKDHFSYIIVAIILVSLLPPVIEIARRKYCKSPT
ncbi:MAG: DedA family protein [Gammaproteobacteria bacterium]